MAHIPDGILSGPVLIGGALGAAGAIAIGLRRLDDKMIPRAAVLAAALFTGSLIAVPVGPSSVHLLFSGLLGVMLGPAAFLAVFVALLLQALLFGFGGMTTLGVNTLNIALPGVMVGLALGPVIRDTARPWVRLVASALAGALPVFGTGAMVALSLWLSSSDYAPVAKIMIATYLPLAIGEAFVTVAVAGFLARVQPEALRPVGP